MLDNHKGNQQAIKVVVIINSRNTLLKILVCFAVILFVAVTGADFIVLLFTLAWATVGIIIVPGLQECPGSAIVEITNSEVLGTVERVTL